MSREIEKYCPAGHSSEDIAYSNCKNFINSDGNCSLCTKERFIQEFKTWSSGNVNIDKVIQEFQINYICDKFHWIPYNDFQNINYIADGGHEFMYSAKLKNGIKLHWNFIRQNWGYHLIGRKVALKEIKDSRYDIVEFLKMVKTINDFGFIAKFYGISKNPSTQNYIIVMESFDYNLHYFLAKKFWNLRWKSKINILASIASGLRILHGKDLVHCDLNSGNILNPNESGAISVIGLDLCKFENDLILNSNNSNNNKSNKIYGSIPYIPPEVLRGNKFTWEGDIYSFGGVMYEIVTAQRPFADQAHDTYLMIDICNGVRPKVPDFMLNWIPEWYLNLMYRCWSDDPSERPTTDEIVNLFWDVSEKLVLGIVNNDVMRQLKIANENQRHTSKSQKQEFFELFSYSSKLHPQSCYFSRSIHTLHGLHDLLEEIKSGQSSVLRGNKFTWEGDIYSFGGVMYEIVTAQRPFADQAHDTYLMIDICNGVRPKVPDFMLNWIPEWYLNLMYRCWSDDPSERPTTDEIVNLFWDVSEKLVLGIVNNDVMRQLKIANENQRHTSKSQKQEFFELFSYSSKLHPQSCYFSRSIHTLHGLHDLLEEIKSGQSSDPNLLY
ncbi:hypothetical protein Glove_117g393 [Diversispora epigaea]|uniref:Protein kinase domain-containing protein n=1 Tax=Diversispora epigaea TaxID=1348612 RepID=A0A397J0A9_9GLOM|nr:hypothetical protein Glove_117g393 [Diversispora epigaea]